MVARLDGIPALLVVSGVSFGVTHHLFDFLFAQTARGRDFDRLFFAGAEILRRHMHDAIGVDIEGHFDLRHAARRHRNTDEIELPEQFVVCCHLTLALENADRNRRLVVLRCRKNLALLSRDRRVTLDQLSKDAAKSFNAEG